MSVDGAEIPVVSVIIPCYQQAHFLHDAIESVLAQSYRQHEVIVVDDGSPDATAAVVARYAGVKYIRQINQGLSAARNTGIQASSGDFLVFLDADDRLLNAALQRGLECFAGHPECAFVSGHHRYINFDGSLLNEYPPEPIDDDRYCALLKRNYVGMHATVMYRRSLFDLVAGFNTALRSCEDYELYLRVARHYPIFRHDYVVAEYRWHGSNMTDNAPRMLASALAVVRSQLEFIQNNPEYVKACKIGVRFWRSYFQARLFARFRACVEQRQWRQTVQIGLMLVKWCHPWLASVKLELVLARRMVQLDPTSWGRMIRRILARNYAQD